MSKKIGLHVRHCSLYIFFAVCCTITWNNQIKFWVFCRKGAARVKFSYFFLEWTAVYLLLELVFKGIDVPNTYTLVRDLQVNYKFIFNQTSSLAWLTSFLKLPNIIYLRGPRFVHSIDVNGWCPSPLPRKHPFFVVWLTARYTWQPRYHAIFT